MKYILLTALLLAGCATPPSPSSTKSVDTLANELAEAYIAEIFLTKCPKYFRVKPVNAELYRSSLTEAKRVFPPNYNPASIQKLRAVLNNDRGCAAVANNYDKEEAGKLTFVEENK
jgi:hypothetical protein